MLIHLPDFAHMTVLNTYYLLNYLNAYNQVYNYELVLHCPTITFFLSPDSHLKMCKKNYWTGPSSPSWFWWEGFPFRYEPLSLWCTNLSRPTLRAVPAFAIGQAGSTRRGLILLLHKRTKRQQQQQQQQR